MLARTRALLLVAPLVAATAVTIAAAPTAAADPCSLPSCATSDGGDGSIGAATSWVTISVSGGSYQSTSGPVEIPDRVPPPCWYTKGRSGAEMAADAVDPYYRRLAHNVGEDYDDWFPDDAQEYREQDGNWWSWQCNSGNFDGSLPEFFDYVDRWAAANPGPIWVPAGQAPPQPPIPTEILMGIARQVV